MKSLAADLTERTDGPRTRRWGQCRTMASNVNTVSNKFVQIAPIWFYALVGRFMEHKDQSNLWGGEIGATLLANFLIALSYIVESAGPFHHSTQILAKDLLQLAWPFCNAEIAEVRASVMFAAGTSMNVLRDDAILGMLFGNLCIDNNMPVTIQQIALSDPNQNCRCLAGFVANKIVSTLRNIENPITVLA
jgi:hypothetical protein